MLNIDFLDASLFMGKDRPYLEGLELQSKNIWGWDNYSMSLENNREIKIRYNAACKQLKLSGSIPYFIDGQNFCNDFLRLKDAISIISDTIDTNLSKAIVNRFEAGITFECPFKPEEIFNSHYKVPGMTTKCFKRGMLYEDGIRQIKLYNAGYRLKRLLNKEMRIRLAIEKGFDPKANYLRLESRYKKPTIYFKQKDLLVEDLFKENFIQACKRDLMNTYQNIKKEGIYTPPQEKRACTLPTIQLLVLKELAIIHGFNPEDLLRAKIHSISHSILNKEDKKNRKRSLAMLSKRITKNKVSCFDLTKIIEQCL